MARGSPCCQGIRRRIALSREVTRSDRAALAAGKKGLGRGAAVIALVVGATISRAARRCRPLLIGSAPSVTPTCRRVGDASFPRGHRFYWKAEFLRAIPDAAIELLLDRFPTVPSPHSFFVFQQVGGAIAQVALGATAYINRDAAYDCFPVSI